MHERLLRGAESASGASASVLGLRDGTSVGLIVADVTEGTDPREVEQEIAQILEEFAADGPRPVELEASRADSERSWSEALAGYDERADLLSRATLLFADPAQVTRHLDEVLAVGADEIRDAAARHLVPSALATLVYRWEPEV